MVEKFVLASVFLIFGNSLAHAEYVSKGKIVGIKAGEKGVVNIVRQSNANQENCSDATNFYISSGGSMLAIILAAYQSNQEIAFKTLSCGGKGYTNKIIEVAIE